MTDDGLRQLRAEISDLEARKHDLELQIESDQAWLVNQGLDPSQVPLQLVDSDGFPKVGVDHHGARIHASSMRSALNDHKKVMTRLGEVLNEFHELLRIQKETGSNCFLHWKTVSIPVTDEHSRIEPESPATFMTGADQYGDGDHDRRDEGPAAAAALIGFARVNSVERGSPAYNSGLRPRDTILRFGTVTLSMTGANRALHSIADLVRRSENRPISVMVLRETCPDPLVFVLTPRSWSGRGLLGCHLVAVVETEEPDS